MRVMFQVLLAGLLTALFAQAAESKGEFVTVGRGQQVWVEWTEPKQGKPVLVLLNGLTYSTKNWNDLSRALEPSGFGILRYDMKGMGKTMLNGPLPVNYSVTWQDQVKVLKSLLGKLKLKRVHLVGLSYGGGIAAGFSNAYPEMVASTILLAPFTEPLPSMDSWIRQQVALTRIAQPWNPSTDDELYDFFLKNFIYSTYPAAEPNVLENPWKLEAIFRMVQGIRKLDAKKETENLKPRSVYLVVAKEDQYIPRGVMDAYWEAVPSRARASRVIASWTEHKIPEAVPQFTAGLIRLLVEGDPALRKGDTFDASTFRGEIWNERAKFKVPGVR